jgi:hypothetical protein
MKVEEAIDYLHYEIEAIKYLISELEGYRLDLELESAKIDEGIVEDILFYIGDRML